MKRVMSARNLAWLLIALDVLLTLGLAVVGAKLGELVLSQYGRLYFYQSYMPEIIYSACGYGFVRPAQIPQSVLDFLLVHTTTFDCASIGAPADAAHFGIFTQVHLYLALTVAALWKIFPIAYANLWPLVMVLSGAYASGCFVLLRLFFGRLPALAGAVVLTFSPIALTMILNLRDYSKAAFFIWSIVFLVASVRPHTTKITMLLAAAAGITVGLGYGFRSDIIILLPIGIVFIGIGIRGGFWRRRLTAIAAFTVATLIVASPMLMTRNAGGFGSILMEGMSEPFRIELGLGDAPYTLGQRYSDELTLSSIAADMRAKDPTWDDREGRAGRAMSQAVLDSGPYVLGWLGLFAGDMATQAIKSAAWIIGFPALIAPGRKGLDPSMSAREGPPASQYALWVYDDLATSWLPLSGIIGLTLFFWCAASTRPREAVALLLMFGALLAYPVVQFSIRHVFHLEFIWVVAALSLIVFPFRLITPSRVALWRIFPRIAVWSLGLVVLVAGVRWLLVAYQDMSLRIAFDALLAQPRELVATSRASTGEDAIFSVPVPNKYRSLVDGPADSMTNFVGVGVQWDVRSAVDRLLLTIGGRDCSAKKLTLSFHYAKRDGAWQPFDHDIVVDLPRDRTTTATVLVPAFYRPSQYLDDVRVPESFAPCIGKIERVAGATRLPAILSAVLPPDWQNRSLHRGFGGFPVERGMTGDP